MLSTIVTEVIDPLVALKLPAPTVPTTPSPNVTVNVVAELVLVATVLSVTAVTAGAVVSNV